MKFWGYWAWVNTLNHTYRDRSGGINPNCFRSPSTYVPTYKKQWKNIQQIIWVLTPPPLCTCPLKICFCETAWHTDSLWILLESRWWGTSLFGLKHKRWSLQQLFLITLLCLPIETTFKKYLMSIKYFSSTPSCLLTRRLVARVYFLFVFRLLVNSEITWRFRIIWRPRESKFDE